MMGGPMSRDGAPMEAAQSSTAFPEHMKVHLEMMQDHLAAVKKFEPAVEALYAALNSDQRKTANELLPMLIMTGRMM